MSSRDRRIDDYIASSAEFARPILTHLRAIVHEACPEVEETIKWSMPAFDYKGLLFGMAAFKQYCAFNLWKGKLIPTAGYASVDAALNDYARITKVSDLPPRRVLLGWLRHAARLNEEGVQAPRAKPKPAKPVVVPADLEAALAKSARARAAFAAMSPSHRREYVEWLAEAKQAGTRARRLATALEWIAQGQSRNWKYERRPVARR